MKFTVTLENCRDPDGAAKILEELVATMPSRAAMDSASCKQQASRKKKVKEESDGAGTGGEEAAGTQGADPEAGQQSEA